MVYGSRLEEGPPIPNERSQTPWPANRVTAHGSFCKFWLGSGYFL